MKDERQTQRAEYGPKGRHVRLVTTPPVDSQNREKRLFTWRVLLVIALIALILTVIFGYLALGPSDMINH